MTKATINREQFLPALAAADGIVEARNTIPILGHTRLVFTRDNVKITATDLDLELNTSAKLSSIEENFDCAAPAKRLHDIVKRFAKNANISIGSDGKEITLSSGKSRVSLPILLADDFPDLPQNENYTQFAINASSLERLFKLSQFAISTEETRYYLCGLYLHLSETENGMRLTSTATDGHRLAKVVVNTEIEGIGSMPGVIVPRKTVHVLIKELAALSKENPTINVFVSNKKIRFEFGEKIITSKLIDGQFPDYERVIPKDNYKIWTLDTTQTLAAIDRVVSVSTTKGRGVKMDFSSGKLNMSAHSPDEGSAEDEVEATEKSEADPVTIGFNGVYFANLLSQLTETFNVELEDAGSAVVFRNLGDEGDDITSLFILMPMRV